MNIKKRCFIVNQKWFMYYVIFCNNNNKTYYKNIFCLITKQGDYVIYCITRLINNFYGYFIAQNSSIMIFQCKCNYFLHSLIKLSRLRIRFPTALSSFSLIKNGWVGPACPHSLTQLTRIQSACASAAGLLKDPRVFIIYINILAYTSIHLPINCLKHHTSKWEAFYCY